MNLNNIKIGTINWYGIAKSRTMDDFKLSKNMPVNYYYPKRMVVNLHDRLGAWSIATPDNRNWMNGDQRNPPANLPRAN
jgi:hypothetical protein